MMYLFLIIFYIILIFLDILIIFKKTKHTETLNYIQIILGAIIFIAILFLAYITRDNNNLELKKILLKDYSMLYPIELFLRILVIIIVPLSRLLKKKLNTK